MALILPLLLGTTFGIVELGATYNQTQQVQHDTREAARVGAIDFGKLKGATAWTSEEAVAEICDHLGRDDDTEVKITLSGTEQGDTLTVEITADLQQTTGLFDQFFGNKTISASATIQLERNISYVAGAHDCPASP